MQMSQVFSLTFHAIPAVIFQHIFARNLHCRRPSQASLNISKWRHLDQDFQDVSLLALKPLAVYRQLSKPEVPINSHRAFLQMFDCSVEQGNNILLPEDRHLSPTKVDHPFETNLLDSEDQLAPIGDTHESLIANLPLIRLTQLNQKAHVSSLNGARVLVFLWSSLPATLASLDHCWNQRAFAFP